MVIELQLDLDALLMLPILPVNQTSQQAKSAIGLRKRDAANGTCTLGNIHRPTVVSILVALHHVPDHRRAKGACCIVTAQRHAPGVLPVAAIVIAD